MKILKILPVIVLSAAFIQVNAQTEIPKGFKKGSLVLADSSSISGYIRENIRSNASLAFVSGSGGKKITYNASSLVAAEIEGTRYTCISGDFFKVICQGNLCFLQKASDASGKPSYNGTETVFSSGTEGKIADYFIYNSRTRQLQLVSKKNLPEITTNVFAGHTAALDKARTAGNDIALLKEAVDIYNGNSN